MSDKFITIKVFDNAPEAHVLISKLENSGINCYLHDAFTISIDPLLNQAIGGIKLKVGSNDLDKAVEIINEIEGVPLTDEANNILKCPKCGATDIYANFKSMKGFWGVFYSLVSLVFFMYPLMYKNVYRCKKCEYEFDKKSK
ncbi:MAG: hypothetical protein COB81_10110 [Flavobacteriaceae bacterium]|nr:MAG: hypothetical protein COB81_10110 [Flavobacteriaceae bacterium]